MNIDTIILSEPKDKKPYYPFSILHPIFEIRVGAMKIWEKLMHEIPNVKVIYSGRKKIINSFLERQGFENPNLEKGVIVVLSAGIIFDSHFFDELSSAVVNYPEKSLRLTHNGIPIGGIFSPTNWVENLTADDIKNFEEGIWDNFSEIEFTKVKHLDSLWDAIYANGKEITEDKQYFKSYKTVSGLKFTGAYLINPENILIGSNVRILPGVVIDASSGPVILSSNVKIMPQATIVGPCYVGDNSTIKIGAKIYPNTSIGEWCKIGGEVEDSIIHGFSNKQHDGFLGHSYISEWVNLGAGTDTSDLKNTYGKISIEIEEERIETGKQFLGFLCGDHTKTAIGSKINSGTVAGICSMIMGSGFPQKNIPSFSWLSEFKKEINKFEKALTTAKIVKGRRQKELTQSEEILLQEEFKNVSKDA